MSLEIRSHLGRQLAALYDEAPADLPLRLVELLARYAVMEAMAAFDRARV